MSEPTSGDARSVEHSVTTGLADAIRRARAEAFEECARIAEMRWLAEPEGFLCADPHAAAAMRARGIADEIRRRAKR